ncbi:MULTISPECIES: VOC family protein [Streptomyces]|uniref:VOC domain-containing protein n=1 Tax=Streptomyces luteosporeus TaxID=173856 RepID=A0ABN3TSK3_9ACTN
MSFMSPGNVVWFEISTTDPEAVKDFYGPLLGWTFETDPDSSIDGRTYTRILAPGAPWPMGAIAEGDPVGKAVSLSVLSTDVAADTARLTALGATVVVPPTQVGDVTVFTRLRDVRGNNISLFSRTSAPRLQERMEDSEQQMEQIAAAPRPGMFAWFEIGTTDPEATKSFYQDAFGWTFVFDETAGGKPYSNIFTGPQWPSGGLNAGAGADYAMPSFLVTDVPATTAEAQAAGAQVEDGPGTNPDGLVYSRLLDPKGNRFGLFSMPTQPIQPAGA